MKIEKLSLALKEVINLSIDEVKVLPEEKRCGMLILSLGDTKILGARVIIVLKEKDYPMPEGLGKEYIRDKKGNFIIAEAPLQVLQLLTEDSNVKHIDKPGPLYPDLEDGLKWAGAKNVTSENLQAQNIGSGNLDGEGVLIGILDSGINYLHPDFSHDNNGTLETIIECIWKSDELEWSREEINAALASENPQSIVPHLDHTDGHGTLVAACAASTGRGTNYKGVAPKASLLIATPSVWGELESDEASNGYLIALNWMARKAMELSQPIVINISKGSNVGPRDGSLPFEGYLDTLIEENTNLVICKTAGNHGNKKHHAQGNVKSDEDNNRNAIFEITREINSFKLDIWYDEEDSFTLELINPQGDTTPLIIEDNPEPNPIHFQDSNGTDDTSFNVYRYYEPESVTLNNTKHFYLVFNLVNPVNSIPIGQYQIKLRPTEINSAPNGNYHCWLDWTRFSTSSPMEFLPTHLSNSQTLNAGACGQNTIIVGNWEDDSGKINENSSQGPTRDGRDGVTVVAPGSEIVGAAPRRTFDYTREPLLQINSGTSFSCPMVAGIIALIYQESMLLNPDGPLPSFTEIRQRLMNTAWQDGFTGPENPNPISGSGKVNAHSAINPSIPITVNKILVHSEPDAALVGDTIEIVVKSVDQFQRGVADENGNVKIELFNIDKGDNAILSLNTNFENGILRETLSNSLEAGHYKIRAQHLDSGVSDTYILNVYESLNNPVLQGSSLVPLGRTGTANAFNFQYLFVNTQSRRLRGRLAAIAWKSIDNIDSRTAGWLDCKIKYGPFNGDFIQDFSNNPDQNLSFVNTLQETDLKNLIVKGIYPNASIRFNTDHTPFLNSNGRPFLVEISFFHSLKNTKCSPNQRNTATSKSFQQVNNNFSSPPSIEENGQSNSEPLLLLDNRFNFSDIWLKSSSNDTGRQTIPSEDLGNSPDIIIRNDDSLDKVVPENHQSPRLNADNYIYVNVRNRGGLAAENVRVSIFWAPLRGGLRTGNLIADNFTFQDAQNREVNSNIQTITELTAERDNSHGNVFQQLKFKWRVNDNHLLENNDPNYALVVVLDHPDDPIQFPEGGIEAHSIDNNLAFKKLDFGRIQLGLMERIMQRIYALIRRLLDLLGF